MGIILAICKSIAIMIISMGHKLSDQVRDAINASGLSRYEICKRLDFNQVAMSRFMAGRGGLGLDVLDRLADLLGLDVTTRRRKRKGE